MLVDSNMLIGYWLHCNAHIDPWIAVCCKKCVHCAFTDATLKNVTAIGKHQTDSRSTANAARRCFCASLAMCQLQLLVLNSPPTLPNFTEVTEKRQHSLLPNLQWLRLLLLRLLR